jgi:hypothetical protein
VRISPATQSVVEDNSGYATTVYFNVTISADPVRPFFEALAFEALLKPLF